MPSEGMAVLGRKSQFRRLGRGAFLGALLLLLCGAYWHDRASIKDEMLRSAERSAAVDRIQGLLAGLKKLEGRSQPNDLERIESYRDWLASNADYAGAYHRPLMRNLDSIRTFLRRQPAARRQIGPYEPVGHWERIGDKMSPDQYMGLATDVALQLLKVSPHGRSLAKSLVDNGVEFLPLAAEMSGHEMEGGVYLNGTIMLFGWTRDYDPFDLAVVLAHEAHHALNDKFGLRPCLEEHLSAYFMQNVVYRELLEAGISPPSQERFPGELYHEFALRISEGDYDGFMNFLRRELREYAEREPATRPASQPTLASLRWRTLDIAEHQALKQTGDVYRSRDRWQRLWARRHQGQSSAAGVHKG